jgi:hypothetical protein
VLDLVVDREAHTGGHGAVIGATEQSVRVRNPETERHGARGAGRGSRWRGRARMRYRGRARRSGDVSRPLRGVSL